MSNQLKKLSGFKPIESLAQEEFKEVRKQHIENFPNSFNVVSDNGIFSRVVSDKYTIFQDAEVMGLVQRRLSESGLAATAYHYAAPSLGGTMTMVLEKALQTPNGDALHMLVSCRNVVGSSIMLRAAALDYYCMNGLTRISKSHAEKYELKLAHNNKNLSFKNIDDSVKSLVIKFESTFKFMSKLYETKLELTDVQKLMETIKLNGDLLGDSLSIQMEQEVAYRGSNLWAAYSAVTHFASHGKRGDGRKPHLLMPNVLYMTRQFQRALDLA